MSQQGTFYVRNLILGIVAVLGITIPVVSMIVMLMNAQEAPIVRVNVGAVGLEPTTPIKAVPPETQSSEDLMKVKKLGKEIYELVCRSCHTAGLAGAPKFGDNASWAHRVAKGEATLISHAINGFNMMPPRGRGNISDEEVKWAVRYMLAAVNETTTTPVVSEPTVLAIVPNKVISEGTPIATLAEMTPSVTSVKKPEKTKPAEASPSKVVARKSGKEVYETACMSCHIVGIAGAPKFGDKASWKERIVKGEAALISNVLNGFNVIPTGGSDSEINDEELKLAVQYMLKAVAVGEITTP